MTRYSCDESWAKEKDKEEERKKEAWKHQSKFFFPEDKQ